MGVSFRSFLSIYLCLAGSSSAVLILVLFESPSIQHLEALLADLHDSMWNRLNNQKKKNVVGGERISSVFFFFFMYFILSE